MIVGIDARPANARKRAGIGNYCYGLLRAMAELPGDVSYRVYLDRAPLDDFPVDPDKVDIRVLPPAKGWTFRRLAKELRHNPPDVFFTAGIQVPMFVPCPRVATVLDLAYMTFPSYFAWRLRLLGPLRARLAVRMADHLMAISEATKNDLVRLLKAPPDSITVAHLGCSAQFGSCRDADEIRRVRQAHDLPERYVLYVGRLQPRKNIGRLIEAFEKLREHRPDLPQHLVIAGDKGWLYDAIFDAASHSGAKDFIRFVGFVPETDLPILISEADVLALVSLWEGFGLPVVEAMACGTAVVTSDRSSLPEVAGDAALLVDPYDADAISRALDYLLTDDAARAALEAKGIERARAFTWENTARATLDALVRVSGPAARTRDR